MVGVLTTFYGYEGRVLDKAKSLAKTFQSIGLRPFIQLHSQREPDNAYEEVVSHLNRLRNEFGIVYSVHQSLWLPHTDFHLNLGSSDSEVWRETVRAIKKSIDFARAINAANVSFHAGYASNQVRREGEFGLVTPIEEISFEEAYSNVERGLEELLDYADNEVLLSVENLCYRPERRYLFSLPGDFEHLVSGVNVLFDVGHANYSEKKLNDTMYTEKMIETIGGRITEMHVSDNNGLEDGHKLVGHGDIPFLGIFKQVLGVQTMPPVIIEATQRRHRYSEENLRNGISRLVTMLSEVGG